MNTIFSAQTWQLLGWTMLHYLWLGAALLLIAAMIRRTLRRGGPNVRYAHSLGTLLALAALPIATAAWLAQTQLPSQVAAGWGSSAEMPPPVLAEPSPQIIELNPNYDPAAEPEASPSAANTSLVREGEAPAEPNPGTYEKLGRSLALPGVSLALPGASLALPFLHTLASYLPWLWLLGTPITFALLATGLVGAERMRRHGTLLTADPVHETCEKLRVSLRITRRVALAVCDRVAQPVLVGIVRPLIFLPPVALTGWSPEQLEMVLLHELAHVRRWDNLVNLAQRVIESLLFFHPAVWIVSTWVRRDREECCDTLVVTRTSQPKQYAELLIALASPQPFAGAALARHPLAGRLRRILKLEDEPMLVSRSTIALVLLIFAIAAGVAYGPLRALGGGQSVADTPSDSQPSSAGEESGEGETNETESEVKFNLSDNSIFENRDLLRKKVFNKSFKNPETTESYSVPVELQEQLRQVFDGIQKDPFGPRIPSFETKWNSDGTVQVAAPKMAHEIFFAQIIPEFVEYIQQQRDSATSGSTEKSSAAEKTTKVYTLPPAQDQLRDYFSDPANLPEPVTVEVVGDKIIVTGSKSLHDKLKEKIPGLVEERSAIRNSDQETLSQANASPTDPFANALAGIAYRSPREGEIAQRAWKELGIKVAPATDAELESTHEHGYRGGLKLLDFNKNFPQLEGATILTQIQARDLSTGIVDFDDLHRALDHMAMRKAEPVLLTCIIGNDKVNYSATYLPKPRSAGNAATRQTYPQLFVEVPPKKDKATTSKAVTRVYQLPEQNGEVLEELEKWLHARKSIKVEPGPGDDDRATITATAAEHEHIAKVLTDVSPKHPFLSLADQKIADRAYKLLGVELEPLTGEEQVAVAKLGFDGGLRVSQSTSGGMGVNDILVGLHVWPTKDLESLNEVLTMDNLPELSPLKFYVVRQRVEAVPIEGRYGEIGRNAKVGSVVTGRIRVDLDQLPPPTPQPPLAPPETLFNPPQLIRPPDLGPSPTLSAPELEAAQPVQPPSDPVAPSIFNEQSSSPNPSPEPAPSPPLPPTPSLRIPQSEIRNPTPVYRYDGKTFQTWRDLWKHELSTEKRIEAVKALAAFGRTGYAKDAAETILDVAGEYDSSNPGSFGTEEINLQTTIISVLGTLDPSVVFPKIMERTTDDPQKWTAFFASYLKNMSKGDSSIAKQVSSLTEHEDSGLRQAALSSLLRIDPAAFDARLSAALNDADSQVSTSAIRALIKRELIQQKKSKGEQDDSKKPAFPFEEVSTLLLHEDPQRQSFARSIFRYTSKPIADEMAGRMLEILRDLERESDPSARRSVIRALGAMKESAQPAQADLKKIATNEKEDLRIRVAAAVALDQIEPRKGEGRTPLFSDVVGEEQGTLIEMVNEEMREVNQPLTRPVL